VTTPSKPWDWRGSRREFANRSGRGRSIRVPRNQARHPAGLGIWAQRPGELRALRWSDVQQNTLLVQRAANPDGSSKPTKTGQHRSVRLVAPLAQDLREYRLAIGRP
jgi:integrase